MRDDKAILSLAVTRCPERPPMHWRGIIAAVALEAFMALMIVAVVWRLISR